MHKFHRTITYLLIEPTMNSTPIKNKEGNSNLKKKTKKANWHQWHKNHHRQQLIWQLLNTTRGLLLVNHNNYIIKALYSYYTALH